jgi:hypothetical protein
VALMFVVISLLGKIPGMIRKQLSGQLRIVASIVYVSSIRSISLFSYAQDECNEVIQEGDLYSIGERQCYPDAPVCGCFHIV